MIDLCGHTTLPLTSSALRVTDGDKLNIVLTSVAYTAATVVSPTTAIDHRVQER